MKHLAALCFWMWSLLIAVYAGRGAWAIEHGGVWGIVFSGIAFGYVIFLSIMSWKAFTE